MAETDPVHMAPEGVEDISRQDGERLGATYLGDERCHFLVWAPRARQVAVRIVAPDAHTARLQPGLHGYHHGTLAGVSPGSQYVLRLDAQMERPDPASRSQPQDVHGPSAVVASDFAWTDAGWSGLPLQEYLLYELHVGTFTEAGTFDAIIPHLDALRELGVTALELMPVAQFPGSRNWGYDGVYPYAAQHSYGGPQGLQRLVDACHQRGLAVVLDVVYNHLGPEGNYLGDFAPYFTDRYKTPWGPALNFDGPHSDHVRRYFIDNALYWIGECHIDALRLDAVHAIVDHSAVPFLEALSQAVQTEAKRLERRVYLIAESNLNDPRLLLPTARHGGGLDAQWNDDFHHALHALLTGERDGYYVDFGRTEHLAKAWADGFVYDGQYSLFRQRRHGRSSRHIAPHQLVVCAQNHDQIGNRLRGERLTQIVSFEGLKLAAAATILSPFLPLLFMGEEYGETAPFPYFISHTDAALIEAVRRGRREEFAAFDWRGETPDPQSEVLFQQARLQHRLREAGQHAVLWDFYQTLIQLRRTRAALKTLRKDTMAVHSFEQQQVLCVQRWTDDDDVFIGFNFHPSPVSITAPLAPGSWHSQLDSADTRWRGPGRMAPELFVSDDPTVLTFSPHSVVLFARVRQTT